MTMALEGGEGSASRPGCSLPMGKNRYPLYRRLCGPHGRSGQVRKISPSHRDSIPGLSSPYPVAIPTELPGPHCLCASTIFWGPDCLLPCIRNKKSLYAMYVLQAYKWVHDICQEECSPTPMWSFMIGHFLWAVLNLQTFELFLCERKPPSLFQHLKVYVIIPYWKFLKHSSELLDLYFLFCLISIVRHLSFYGIDCVRWQ